MDVRRGGYWDKQGLIGKLLVLLGMLLQLVLSLQWANISRGKQQSYFACSQYFLFWKHKSRGKTVFPELFSIGTGNYVISVLRYICVYQMPEFGKNKLERVKEGLGMKNPFVEASLISGYVCCCSEIIKQSLSLVEYLLGHKSEVRLASLDSISH